MIEAPARTAPIARAGAAPAPQVVLDVPLAPLTMEQVVHVARGAIAQRRRLLIGVVNAAKIVNMRRDARLRSAVLAADVILADGMSVVWAARLLGRPVPERVAGIDLMDRLLADAERSGARVFLLGAEQAVLDEVRRRIEQRHPRLSIAGAHHGFFTAADEPRIAAAVRNAGADVLLVGMSSPKKECFLARWADEMNVPVCHGVGGAFDVLAGKVRRAPRIWQRLGLEWLYRMLQEPRRLAGRYFVTNTMFGALLLGAVTRRLVGRS